MMRLTALTLMMSSGAAAAFTTTTTTPLGFRDSVSSYKKNNNDNKKQPLSITTTTTQQQLSNVLEEEKTKKQQPVIMTMSKALPFLKCPPALADCDFAGNVGFDPLGLAKNKEQLWEYREAEIKHARLAMLAAVGWPSSELWDRAVAIQFGMNPVLDDTGRAPSLLNGGLGRVSPIWWGFCIGLSAAIDMYGIEKARRSNAGGENLYRPGMLEFDPLNLYPSDKQGQERMELAEMKHGRLAMLTVVSYSLEEWITKMAVVDETPILFNPLLS